jgi:hypothetical protein
MQQNNNIRFAAKFTRAAETGIDDTQRRYLRAEDISTKNGIFYRLSVEYSGAGNPVMTNFWNSFYENI